MTSLSEDVWSKDEDTWTPEVVKVLHFIVDWFDLDIRDRHVLWTLNVLSGLIWVLARQRARKHRPEKNADEPE